MAVPVRLDLAAWVEAEEARLTRAVRRGIEDRRQRHGALVRVLPRPEALLADPSQRLDRAGEALPRALTLMAERKRAGLLQLAAGLRPGVLRGRLQREAEVLRQRGDGLGRGLRRAVERKGERLEALASRLQPARLAEDRRRKAEALERVAPRLEASFGARLRGLSDRLAALERTRRTLGYEATLARGYAVVRAGGAVVTEAEVARGAGVLEIEFKDGRVEVGGGVRPGKRRGSADDGQGDLF